MASSICDRKRRLSVVVVAMLAAVSVGLGGTSAARAEQAAASDATREAARRKLVEGVDAMKRGDYEAALARFEQAYALVPSPKIHYDFGMAYVGLGRPAEALAAFERFLAEAPDAPPEKREKAASLVSTLRARVGPPAERDDRVATAGRPQAVAPPAASSGRPEPTSSLTQVPTEHRDERSATVTATTTPAESDPLRGRRVTAVSLGAAGVGLVAAGVGFGVLAKGESDSLSHDSQIATPGDPTLFDPGKQSRGIAYERLQIVSLVAGGVAVAAGAVLYATTWRRVAVEPVAGPSHAGATLRLAF
jgi:tetratricopeptide (TPR) repeat protein